MSQTQTAVHEQTDEELIAAFQDGETRAFDLIVGRYKDKLVNFVYRYLGDYDEADDVVQETFVRVYWKRESYKPVAKFSTWIYTIATNLAKTHLRRRKRHALFSLTSQAEGYDEREQEIPDVRYLADASVDSTLKHEIIQKALDSISAKYREVVILFDIQQLSYNEICVITGLNIGTVKSRLSRGRALLRPMQKDIVND